MNSSVLTSAVKCLANDRCSEAIYYEDLIRNGHVHVYAKLATLDHVTRSRVTQIMNLRLLAPDIQEQLFSLDRIVEGWDWLLCLGRLQTTALEPDWRRQRKHWSYLVSR